MSDSDSEKYDGLELWHDVVSIIIHPPIDTNGINKVPPYNKNNSTFKDFANARVFKFQRMFYHFNQQTDYRNKHSFHLPEVSDRLKRNPNIENFQKIHHFLEEFTDWCEKKIDAINLYFNYIDIDDDFEFIFSDERGPGSDSRKQAIANVKSYTRSTFKNSDSTHLLKIKDLNRFLHFFKLDMLNVVDNITPIGGPTQEKQPPYITQMDPSALQLFFNFLTQIDNVNGYGNEDTQTSTDKNGNKKTKFLGVGKDLVKPIDDIIKEFESSRAKANKSKKSAPPAPSSSAAAAPALPKVDVLPPNWTTSIYKSTGKIVYEHPHCASTFTHPRELEPKKLLPLISKKIGKDRKLNGWTIHPSSSKNGYIKYIKGSKAQYENPFDLASKHRDTKKKSSSSSSSSAAASNRTRTKPKTFKISAKKLAALSKMRKKKGGKRKTKRRNKSKVKTKKKRKR